MARITDRKEGKTMLYAMLEKNGKTFARTYNSYSMYYNDTFNPEIDVLALIDTDRPPAGKNYHDKRNTLQGYAITFQATGTKGLPYWDLYRIGNYFEYYGKRYGLLKEFRDNGII